MALVPQITGCFQITFLIEIRDFVDTSVKFPIKTFILYVNIKIQTL